MQYRQERLFRLLATLITSLSLTACTWVGAQPQSPSGTTGITPTAKTPDPTQPFTGETLYSLLVAEMAMRRQDPQLALESYLEQASVTRDPEIAGRATRLARAMGAHEQAMQSAQLWASLDPTNPEPIKISAAYATETLQYVDAVKLSTQLLEMGESTYFVQLAVMSDRLSSAERLSLIDQYDALLEQYGSNADLLMGKAIFLEYENRFDEATSAADAALDAAPDNNQALLLKTHILQKTGKHDEALRHLEKSVKQYPGNNALRLQYARALLRQDQLETALTQFEILLAGNPADGDLILTTAMLEWELKDIDAARDKFEQLVYMDMHSDQANYFLAMMEEKNDNWQAALQYLQQVQSGDFYMHSLMQYTRISVEHGQYAAASAYLATQRTLNPSVAEGIYVIESDAFFQHKLYQEALATLDTALQQYTQSPVLMYSRALVHEKNGDIALAEQDLRKLLALKPDNVDAMNALGYILAVHTSRTTEAYDLIQSALQQQPDNPAFQDSMGWVLYRMGKLEEAETYLRNAQAGLPNAEVAAHLGEVLWQQGKQAEAAAIWDEATQKEPDNDIIPATRKRLQDKQ